PPTSPLFPYTTLFRSHEYQRRTDGRHVLDGDRGTGDEHGARWIVGLGHRGRGFSAGPAGRAVAACIEYEYEYEYDSHAEGISRRDRKSTRLNSSHRTI